MFCCKLMFEPHHYHQKKNMTYLGTVRPDCHRWTSNARTVALLVASPWANDLALVAWEVCWIPRAKRPNPSRLSQVSHVCMFFFPKNPGIICEYAGFFCMSWWSILIHIRCLRYIIVRSLMGHFKKTTHYLCCPPLWRVTSFRLFEL